MKVNKEPSCSTCPDAPPDTTAFLTKFYRDLYFEIRSYRDGMSGRFEYRYIKEYIEEYHGKNEFTKAFIKVLPTFEAIEADWSARRHPKK